MVISIPEVVKIRQRATVPPRQDSRDIRIRETYPPLAMAQSIGRHAGDAVVTVGKPEIFEPGLTKDEAADLRSQSAISNDGRGGDVATRPTSSQSKACDPRARDAGSQDTDWSGVGCGAKRAVADVSADADPYTGLAVHDTSPECEYQYEEAKVKHVLYWCTIGGTSVASPLIASVFALAGGASKVDDRDVHRRVETGARAWFLPR